MTLEVLSMMPKAPALGTLKRKCSADSWLDQKKAFRNQTIAKVTENDTTRAAVAKVDQIFDAVDMITRHSRAGRNLQAIAMNALALFAKEPARIAELSPTAIATFLKLGIDLERMAAGMATQHIEVDAGLKLEEMSDRQLELIATGEDADKVLQLN